MRNIFLCLFMIGTLSACSSETPNRQDVEIEVGAGLNEVNVYSARKGYLLKPLIDEFEKSTKIKVNIISGKSKSLQKRIEQEGENTRADVLLTVDAGNLYKAKTDGLLQSIKSAKLNTLIPEHLRDKEGYWYGLSIRSRVIMLSLIHISEPTRPY